MGERMRKSANDKILTGVCGGLAEYFRVDPVLVRLAFVIITVLWGAGLLVYLALAIIMPSPAHQTLTSAETVRQNLDELSNEATARAAELRAALKGGDDRRRTAFGLFLVLIGLLAIAAQTGMLRGASWSTFGPLILIGLGGAVALGVFHRRSP